MNREQALNEDNSFDSIDDNSNIKIELAYAKSGKLVDTEKMATTICNALNNLDSDEVDMMLIISLILIKIGRKNDNVKMKFSDDQLPAFLTGLVCGKMLGKFFESSNVAYRVITTPLNNGPNIHIDTDEDIDIEVFPDFEDDEP